MKDMIYFVRRKQFTDRLEQQGTSVREDIRRYKETDKQDARNPIIITQQIRNGLFHIFNPNGQIAANLRTLLSHNGVV